MNSSEKIIVQNTPTLESASYAILFLYIKKLCRYVPPNPAQKLEYKKSYCCGYLSVLPYTDSQKEV